MIDHNPEPPPERDTTTNPWPQVPRVHTCSPAHEEGVIEGWALSIDEFLGNEHGLVRGIRLHRSDRSHGRAGAEVDPARSAKIEMECELVLIAAGFAGTERGDWLDDLGVDLGSAPHSVLVDARFATTAENVFACGDMARGASLVVWAIAEGRACAAAVDTMLQGRTQLPAPVTPSDRPF